MIGLLILVGIAPFAGYVFLQFPGIQTWLAHKVIHAVEHRIDGRIQVDRISIAFFNKVIAHDIVITGNRKDNGGDTLTSIGTLSLSFHPGDILGKRLNFNRIRIENGCFNLVTENLHNGTNLKRIFRLPEVKDTTRKTGDIPPVRIADITLRNMRFNLLNPVKDTIPRDSSCLNFKNLRLTDINARLTRAKHENGVVSCRIRDLNCRERSGYRLKYLSGNFSLDSTEARIDNLSVRDSYSSINSEYFYMRYRSGKDLQDYVNKIEMGADFFNTVVDFRSIAYYAPSLKGNRLRYSVEGEVSGPVRDLKSRNLVIRNDRNTDISIGIAITGLPDIENTIFNATFKNIRTTTPEIEEVISSFSRQGMKKGSLSSFIPEEKIDLKGLAYGHLSDLYSIGKISTGIGGLEYELNVGTHPEDGRRSIEGTVSTTDLHIGKIIGQPVFGELSMNSALKAYLPDRERGMSIRLDSLLIGRFYVNGCEHNDLRAIGNFDRNVLDLRLISHSESLPMILQGVAGFREEKGIDYLKLFMDVPVADLKAMNIVRNGEKAIAGIKAFADLKIRDDRNIFGEVVMGDISYANDHGHYRIDSLSIKSITDGNDQRISIQSPLLTAEYTSNGSPTELLDRIRSSVIARHFPSWIQDSTELKELQEAGMKKNKSYYNIELTTLNTYPFTSTHFPGVRIADDTHVNFRLDTLDRSRLDIDSRFIFWGNSRFRELKLNAENDSSDFRMNLEGGRIILGEMSFENNRLNLHSDGRDSLRLGYRFTNESTEYKDTLNFSSLLSFDKSVGERLTTHIDIRPSKLFFKDFDWSFSPSRITLGEKYCDVRDFRLYSENKDIRIHGRASPDLDSALAVDLKRFDISIVNAFTHNRLNLKGSFSGDIKLINPFTDRGITMSLQGVNVSLHEHEIDRMSLLSKWDENNKRFNILVNNRLHGNNQLNVFGYYTPARNYINLKLSLKDLGLYYITPFFKDIFTIDRGTVTGDLDIYGELDRIVISSKNCRIDSLHLMPQYTKVPYLISGPLKISEKSIDLENVSITDSYNHKGTLNGRFTHTFFNDIYLDARLKFKDLHCLNTREFDNDLFYGTAFGSGDVRLSGPPDNLSISTEFRTTGNTVIHVPLSSSSSASKNDLISYRKEEDLSVVDETSEDYILNHRKEGTVRKKSNINLNAKASITPNALVQLEMNKQIGEILKCSGDGNIDVEINPAKNILQFRGDYTIAEGSYHFPLYIQSRDFLINEGGTITFNGDFKNTELDVGATYKTKASISTLISDTTSVGNRRMVDCGINLKGSLNNPEISFDIEIPDLDPVTKGRVESALSTPAKIQKQFMALLISGSFVPDEQSGIVNNSTILYSNASEILSNQFNNIFRQLDIPLDLGLNYQPGSGKGGKDMFDVAISYQAFNNRLIINGNVGNSERSSNWAGDFDAEIKVDRNGKFRVTLFTRSADNYSNYLDNTQRSGFGFTFQDEFNTFGEFWRNIFMTRKKREEYELKELLKAEEEVRKEAAAADSLKAGKDLIRFRKD